MTRAAQPRRIDKRPSAAVTIEYSHLAQKLEVPMFAPTTKLSRTVLAFGSIVLLPIVHAQNLVPNPDFNAPISSSWTSTTGAGCGAGCSAALDLANGHPTTPSARLVRTAPGNSGQLLVSACIPYSGAVFDMGAYRRTNVVDANSLGSVDFYFWSARPAIVGTLAQSC